MKIEDMVFMDDIVQLDNDEEDDDNTKPDFKPVVDLYRIRPEHFKTLQAYCMLSHKIELKQGTTKMFIKKGFSGIGNEYIVMTVWQNIDRLNVDLFRELVGD